MLKLLAPAVLVVVHGASSWGSEAQAPGDLASSGDPGGPAYTPAGLCLETRRNLASRTGALTLLGVCVCVCLCVCALYFCCCCCCCLPGAPEAAVEEGLEMTVVPPWLRRVKERKPGPVNPAVGEQNQLGLS